MAQEEAYPFDVGHGLKSKVRALISAWAFFRQDAELHQGEYPLDASYPLQMVDGVWETSLFKVFDWASHLFEAPDNFVERFN